MSKCLFEEQERGSKEGCSDMFAWTQSRPNEDEEVKEKVGAQSGEPQQSRRLWAQRSRNEMKEILEVNRSIIQSLSENRAAVKLGCLIIYAHYWICCFPVCCFHHFVSLQKITAESHLSASAACGGFVTPQFGSLVSARGLWIMVLLH